MSIDKGPQLGDYDTITREQYRRVNGASNGAAASRACLECGTALTIVQVKRGGRFCSLRCSGTHNARIGNETSPGAGGRGTRPARDRTPAGAGRELADQVAPRHGHTRLSAPGEHLEAASPVNPDDHGLIHIAAALVDVLLTIPGTHSVEMWVGPIGPIEVRR